MSGRGANLHVLKVLSGGQTGVDRAALDAALVLGVACGGWCPAGRLAEDGAIPDRYPLQEMAGGYLARNRQNAWVSDGTLVIAFGQPVGGTAKTLEFCRRFGKPTCEIDADEMTVETAASAVVDFVWANRLQTLNVAGPSASGEPRAYGFAHAVISRALSRLTGSPVTA